MTDGQTDGQTNRQMSIARCDLTKLDAHKNDNFIIVYYAEAAQSWHKHITT